MSSWIFIVTTQPTNQGQVSGEEIFRTRMRDEFWGLEAKTPNRNNLKEGDDVVFYLGAPLMVFAGVAKLTGSSFKLTHEQLEQYGHGRDHYAVEYGVFLKEINEWREYRNVKELAPSLNFIENKEYWYSYFQGGVRFLPDDDYLLITSQRHVPLSTQMTQQEDLESQADFALEFHLEEFIYNNWDSVDFGRPLKLYETGEATGRQFPADRWSIDFLCQDKETQDLVVVELKRGKTSDAVVGQLARYMVWVRENMAAEGQDVHGIIIANQVDDALTTAARIHPKMAVMTYKVDFQLREV